MAAKSGSSGTRINRGTGKLTARVQLQDKIEWKIEKSVGK